jgi:4-hydroxy-3-methylbut-2-enyl diphosphate reductase
MRLILPNPRGFCAGVRMAVDVIDQVLELFPDQTVYAYHEIVHNKHVVGRFRDRGVRFVDTLSDVPEGSIIVFSAHGVAPAVLEEAKRRKLRAVDATCPLVTKVHNEARRYAAQGYQILLVGHKDHQEIVGTFGEAPQATQIVESPEDIARLKIDDPQRLVYLTQTTLSTDDAKVIIDALKAAFPAIHAPPAEDICYATTNRQHAVRELAPFCDVVIVIGSRNSSNSIRLTEISRNCGTPAHRIDDASELDLSWFPAGSETVLVTSGASAPEDLVAAVCRTLVARFGATIHTADITPEAVEFRAPVGLRRMMEDRGIDPSTRRFRVEPPTITRELYGAVPVTISMKRN